MKKIITWIIYNENQEENKPNQNTRKWNYEIKIKICNESLEEIIFLMEHKNVIKEFTWTHWWDGL